MGDRGVRDASPGRGGAGLHHRLLPRPGDDREGSHSQRTARGNASNRSGERSDRVPNPDPPPEGVSREKRPGNRSRPPSSGQEPPQQGQADRIIALGHVDRRPGDLLPRSVSVASCRLQSERTSCQENLS